jgi:ssDNA-specific exonuclease RecJ
MKRPKSETDYLYENMKRIAKKQSANYHKFVLQLKPPVDEDGNYLVKTKDAPTPNDKRAKIAVNNYKQLTNKSKSNIKNLYNYSKDLSNGLVEVDESQNMTYEEKTRDRTEQIKTATDYLKILFGNDQKQIGLFTNYLLENNNFEAFNNVYPDLYAKMDKSKVRGANNAIRLFKIILRNDIDDNFVFSEANVDNLVENFLKSLNKTSTKNTGQLFDALGQLEALGKQTRELDEQFKLVLLREFDKLSGLVENGNLKQTDVIRAIRNIQQLQTGAQGAPVAQGAQGAPVAQGKKLGNKELDDDVITREYPQMTYEAYMNAIIDEYETDTEATAMKQFISDRSLIALTAALPQSKDDGTIDKDTRDAMKRVYKVIYGKQQTGVTYKSKISRLKEVMAMINPALDYIINIYNEKNSLKGGKDTKPLGDRTGTLQDIKDGNDSGTAQGAPTTGSGLRRNKKPKRMMKYY